MSQRSGLTLIEVLMALVLTALVMLLASAWVRVVVDHARHEPVGDVAVHRVFNLWREVGLQVRMDGGGIAVAGDRHDVRVHSWCDAAGGWSEPCEVRLSVSEQPAGACVVALTTPTTTHAIDSVLPCGIRYLAEARHGGLWQAEARHGGLWQAEWHDAVHLPEAVEVVAGRDTLLARVGKRG